MLTTKSEFQIYTLEAAAKGKLVIPRHHPSSLTTPERSYRTVLTPALADCLDGVIQTGNFNATLYQNTDYPATPDYVAVEVLDPQFLTTASGVQSFASAPDFPKDRLIFYSGFNQGWHCCGEDSAWIQARIAAGTLVPVGTLI